MPISRPLADDVLLFDLKESGSQLGKLETLPRTGRAARTLVKDGSLRATLVRLAPEGRIPSHRADGPVTIHVLEGSIRVTAAGADHVLASGNLLALGPGVEHSVDSEGGGMFLLTVALG